MTLISTTVTYQNLLDHVRKAKMHDFESKYVKQFVNVFTTDTNLLNHTTPGNSSILNAISNPNQSLNECMDCIESNYSDQLHKINAIVRSQCNYRGM